MATNQNTEATRSEEKRKARRTFGDLQRDNVCRHLSARCSFCKRDQFDSAPPEYKGARAYSTRHYICDPCIDLKRDELLPAVAKAERFARQMAKEGRVSGASAVAAISGCSLEYAERVWAEARS